MKSCYVVYEKTQKAGSFTILHTCSVVPSKTVMLFAGNPSIEPLSPDRVLLSIFSFPLNVSIHLFKFVVFGNPDEKLSILSRDDF